MRVRCALSPVATIAGASAIALGASSALGQPVDLASLFPMQGEVRVVEENPATPLVRVVLPVEVLEQTRPDLSDIRLLDGDGAELPFLVEPSPEAVAPAREVRATLTARPRLLAAQQRTIERDDAPSLRRERYELEPPPSGDREGEGPWTLAIDSETRSFVRSLALAEHLGAGAERPVLQGGSLFRLADGRELRRYVLPPLDPASSLVVEIEGEEPSYLVPSFRYERSRALGAGVAERPGTRVSLERIEARSENGETVLVLDRPAGVVPQALVIETATAAFRRPVEVRDLGAGGDGRRLGAGVIFRVPGAEGVLEHLRIELLPARGERLEVRLVDGDSPPLEVADLQAEIRRPALLFAYPAGGAVTLYFGGGRARAPRYDLEGLLPELPATGDAARVGALLYDRRSARAAELGPLVANPRHEPGPVLAAAMRPGRELDPRLFSHRRRLTVADSKSGLSRLELRPEDLAVTRPDFADLRIADEEARQWPYLLHPDVRTELHELRVDEESRDGGTRFRLVPRAGGALPAKAVVLAVETPFFDRPYELWGELPDSGEVLLRTGDLRRHRADETRIEISFPPRRIAALELRVQDGSEQPLEVPGAELAVTVPELLFPAPAGDYRLLLGFADAEAPSYDLGRARNVVFALDAASVEAGPLEANPESSRTARLARGAAPARFLVWGAIVLAVVVLTVLTIRLAGRHPEDSGPA